MTSNDTITKELEILAKAQESKDVQDVKQGTATEEQKNSVEYTICPCCGKPTLVKPVEVKGPLLDYYIACLVSGTSFSHSYPIYGGKINVTVQQLDRKKALMLDAAMTVMDMVEKEIPVKKAMLDDFRGLLKLYCNVTAISIVSGGIEKTLEPYKAVSEICAELETFKKTLFGEKPQDVLSVIQPLYDRLTSPDTISALPGVMLVGIVETHNQLYNVLLNVGFDTNFWKGIELS